MSVTLAALCKGIQSPEVRRIEEAYFFAKKNLKNFPRRTGESYFQHGSEVALTALEVRKDPMYAVVAILHDLLVHPEGKALVDFAPLLGDERFLVEEMHVLRRLHIDASTQDLDKVIAAFATDSRLLVLRMAHRLNDVRHFDRFTGKLKKDVANETLHMYAPIAGRLGFYAWRYEMEDRCFAVLQPKIFKKLQKKFTELKPFDLSCLHQAQKFLLQKFKTAGIDARIDFRIKGFFSTYRKMVLKHRKFEELTDRLALRIIVPDIDDCYKALGIVHRMMHPVPGKLKDYIGAPKENGYRSIHTAVYPLPGVTTQPMEIQIRTESMHKECEFGESAHGDYKHLRYRLSVKTSRVDIFRNLETLRLEAGSPKQFEQALCTYFRHDHLVIFDEKNNIFHIKKPVTVMDFLCFTVPERCKFLKEVKVNGKIDEFDRLLHDGDVVEARFGRAVSVKNDWIHSCQQRHSKLFLKKVLAESV